jgi:hypothetical protein
LARVWYICRTNNTMDIHRQFWQVKPCMFMRQLKMEKPLPEALNRVSVHWCVGFKTNSLPLLEIECSRTLKGHRCFCSGMWTSWDFPFPFPSLSPSLGQAGALRICSHSFWCNRRVTIVKELEFCFGQCDLLNYVWRGSTASEGLGLAFQVWVFCLWVRGVYYVFVLQAEITWSGIWFVL